MIVERFHIGSNFTKLVIGSILVALVISLGMMIILNSIGFSVNPAIPAVVAAVGAAIYAARMRA